MKSSPPPLLDKWTLFFVILGFSSVGLLLVGWVLVYLTRCYSFGVSPLRTKNSRRASPLARSRVR